MIGKEKGPLVKDLFPNVDYTFFGKRYLQANYNTKGEFMDRNLEKEEILKSMARLKKSYLRVYDYHRRLADNLWLKINDLDMQMQGLADDLIAESYLSGENHENFGGEREENTWTN